MSGLSDTEQFYVLRAILGDIMNGVGVVTSLSDTDKKRLCDRITYLSEKQVMSRRQQDEQPTAESLVNVYNFIERLIEEQERQKEEINQLNSKLLELQNAANLFGENHE